MTKTDLKKIQNCSIYPTGSIITTEKAFVNIHKRERGCSNWTCFHLGDNKSFYLDSFGGSPDNFFLNQLPKPIIFLN